MHTSPLLITTLMVTAINAQSHPVIKPVSAALALRQLDEEDFWEHGYESSGLSTCVGEVGSADFCIDSNSGFDPECCSQEWSQYACYTEYCDDVYLDKWALAIDEACGPQIAQPVPTGTPDAGPGNKNASDNKDEATKTGDAASAHATTTGDVASAGATTTGDAWSLKASAWGLMAFAAVVGLLV